MQIEVGVQCNVYPSSNPVPQLTSRTVTTPRKHKPRYWTQTVRYFGPADQCDVTMTLAQSCPPCWRVTNGRSKPAAQREQQLRSACPENTAIVVSLARA